jgi:hypothetical protein
MAGRKRNDIERELEQEPLELTPDQANEPEVVIEDTKPEAAPVELVTIINAMGRRRECAKTDLAYFEQRGYQAE